MPSYNGIITGNSVEDLLRQAQQTSTEIADVISVNLSGQGGRDRAELLSQGKLPQQKLALESLIQNAPTLQQQIAEYEANYKSVSGSEVNFTYSYSIEKQELKIIAHDAVRPSTVAPTITLTLEDKQHTTRNRGQQGTGIMVAVKYNGKTAVVSPDQAGLIALNTALSKADGNLRGLLQARSMAKSNGEITRIDQSIQNVFNKMMEMSVKGARGTDATIPDYNNATTGAGSKYNRYTTLGTISIERLVDSALSLPEVKALMKQTKINSSNARKYLSAGALTGNFELLPADLLKHPAMKALTRNLLDLHETGITFQGLPDEALADGLVTAVLQGGGEIYRGRKASQGYNISQRSKGALAAQAAKGRQSAAVISVSEAQRGILHSDASQRRYRVAEVSPEIVSEVLQEFGINGSIFDGGAFYRDDIEREFDDIELKNKKFDVKELEAKRQKILAQINQRIVDLEKRQGNTAGRKRMRIGEQIARQRAALETYGDETTGYQEIMNRWAIRNGGRLIAEALPYKDGDNYVAPMQFNRSFTSGSKVLGSNIDLRVTMTKLRAQVMEEILRRAGYSESVLKDVDIVRELSDKTKAKTAYERIFPTFDTLVSGLKDAGVGIEGIVRFFEDSPFAGQLKIVDGQLQSSEDLFRGLSQEQAVDKINEVFRYFADIDAVVKKKLGIYTQLSDRIGKYRESAEGWEISNATFETGVSRIDQASYGAVSEAGNGHADYRYRDAVLRRAGLMPRGSKEYVAAVMGEFTPDEESRRRMELQQFNVDRKIIAGTRATQAGVDTKSANVVTVGWGNGYTVDLSQLDLSQSIDGRFKYGTNGQITQQSLEQSAYYQVQKAVQERAKLLGTDAQSLRVIVDPTVSGTPFTGGFKVATEDGRYAIEGRGVEVATTKWGAAVDEMTEDIKLLNGFLTEIVNLGVVTQSGNVAGQQVYAQHVQNGIGQYLADSYNLAFTKNGAYYVAGTKAGIQNSFWAPTASADPLGQANRHTRARGVTSVENIRNLLNRVLGSEQGFEKLQEIDKYLYDGYEGHTTATEGEALIDSIIKAVDLSSNEYKKLVEIANQKGRAVRGLHSYASRYPLSNGQDIATIGLFADSSDEQLTGTTIRYDAGTNKTFNADFDGDKVLNVVVGLTSSLEQLKTVLEHADFLREQQARMSAAQEERIRQDRAGLSGLDAENKPRSGYTLLSKEELAKYANLPLERAANILTGLNKPETGVLSNDFQAWTNYAFKHKIDEAVLGDGSLTSKQREEAVIRAGQGASLRTLLEAITQEAISAKKVGDILSSDLIKNIDSKSDGEVTAEIIQIVSDSLTTVKAMLRDSATFGTDKGWNKFLTELERLGVIETKTKDDGSSSTKLTLGRLEEHLLQDLYRMTGTQDKNKQARLFSRIFGKEIQAEQLDTWDPQTGAYTFGGINGKLERFVPTLEELRFAIFQLNRSLGGTTIGEVIAAGPQKGGYEQNKDTIARLYGQYQGTSSGNTAYEGGDIVINGNVTIKAGKVVVEGSGSGGGLIGQGTTLTNTPPGFQYVTERAKMVAGGIGQPTSGPYGHIRAVTEGAFDEINKGLKSIDDFGYRRGRKKGETLDEYQEYLNAHSGMTNKERARYFGYSSVKNFEQDRGSILATERGTYAGKVAEALGRVKLATGRDYTSIDALLADADKDTELGAKLRPIAKEFRDAQEHYRQLLQILGYTGTQFSGEMEGGLTRGEKHYNTLNKRIQAVGGSLVGMEMGGSLRDSRGTTVFGRTDAEYFAKGKKKNGEFYDDYVITDFKTTDAEITPQYLAQLALYQEIRRRQQSEIRDIYSKDGEKGLEKWAREHAKEFGIEGGKNAKREDIDSFVKFLNRFKDARNIKTELQSVNSNGEAVVYNIGELPADIISAAGEGVEWTSEQRRQALGQVSHTVISTGRGSRSDKGGKGGRKGSETLTDEERNQRLNEYLALLNKQYDIKLRLYELDERIKVATDKGDMLAAQALQEQSNRLRALYELQMRQMNGIAYGQEVLDNELPKKGKKSKPRFNEADQKRIEGQRQRSEVNLQFNQEKFLAEYGLESQVQTESEINQLLQERLRLEQQVAAEKKKISTSILGKEKAALSQVINLQEEQLKNNTSELARLVGSDIARPERIQELLTRYQVQKGLNDANVAAGDRGNMSLMDRFKTNIRMSMARTFDYGFSMRLLYSIPRTLQKIYQLTQQLEGAITDLRIVTGMNREEAEATMITYQKLGKELGATTQEVAQSATTWLRQGYSVQEAGKLIDASMKLSKLGFMQSEQATQNLTAAIKGFKLEVNSALDVVDKLTVIDQKAAVSAQGVSEALSLMANSARLAGLDINQAIAMVSTVGEVTQQSMNTVGNAMKTMLARFGNVKAGTFTQMSEGSDETTDNINDIEKVLGSLGIKIRSAAGEMRDFDDVLKDVANQWSTLDSVSKNAIAGALGGVRQREAVVTLLENYERYVELAKESEDSAGTADEKYEAYANSLEAALKRLTNAWEEFTQKVEASGIVKGGVKVLTELIRGMDELVSLLGAVGGRLLAIKAPTWLGSFFSNNIGGGKGRSFLRRLVGGNNASIGIHQNNKRLANYSSQIDAWGREANQLQSDWERGNITEKEYMAKQKDLVARGKALKENKPKPWAEDTDKTRGLGKTNSLLEQILTSIRAQRGDGTADNIEQKMTQTAEKRVEIEKELTNVEQQDINTTNMHSKSVAQDTLTESTEAKTNIESAQTESTEAKTNIESAQTEIEEMRANLVSAQSEAAGAGVNSAVAQQGKGAVVMSKLTSAKGSQVLGAVGGGAMSGLMSASMTNTVGDSGVSGWLNKTDQTVEADTADKAIKGVFAGGLAAVGTYFLGPLGGILGNVIGGGIADLISYMRHKDELERKQRVAEAQERLAALQKMTGVFENFTGVVHKEILEANDYTELYNVIDELKTLFVDNREGEAEFVEAVFEGVGEGLEGYSHSLSGIEKALTGTNMALREAVSNIVQAQLLKQERDAYLASQEQVLYDASVAQQKLSGKTPVALAGYDYVQKQTRPGKYEIVSTSNLWANDELNALLQNLNNRGVIDLSDVREQNVGQEFGTTTFFRDFEIHGTTLQEQAKNAEILKKELRSVYNEENTLYSKISETSDELTRQAELVEQVYQKVREYDVQIGITASNIRNLTEDEKKAYGVEGVYYLVAEAMEKQGIAVRSASGLIKQEYLPVIEKALRQEGSLAKLLKGETKTYGDLTRARKKFIDAVGATSFDKNTWQELRNLLERGDLDTIKTRYADTFGAMANEDIIAVITGADPRKLRDLAQALGMTTEKMHELGPALENVSVSLALEGAEAIRTLKDEYAGLWKELSRGTLSMESLEKVLEKMPELALKLKDRGDLKQFLLDNILGEDSTYEVLYQNQIFKEYTRNKAVFEPFKESFNADIEKAISGDETLTKAWNNAETFEEAWDVLFSNAVQSFEDGALAQKIAQEFDFELEYKDPFKEAFLDAYLEEAKYLLDEQLENLNAQKEALSSINDERKKELELMKAQEALENAKKEKKRVYREGVGFVYEADEEAISSAQDELDELETQQQQENLQIEIDRLELEKEILEYLPTMEERAALKEVYDETNKKLEGLNGTSLPNNTNALTSATAKMTTLNKSVSSAASAAQSLCDFLKKPPKEDGGTPENNSPTSGSVNMNVQFENTLGGHKETQQLDVSNLITQIKAYQGSQDSYEAAQDTFNKTDTKFNATAYDALRVAQELRNNALRNVQAARQELGSTITLDELEAAFKAADQENGAALFQALTNSTDGILKQTEDDMSDYKIGWRIEEAMSDQPSGGVNHTGFEMGQEHSVESQFVWEQFTKHPKRGKIYEHYKDAEGNLRWRDEKSYTTDKEGLNNLREYDVVGNNKAKDKFLIKINGKLHELVPYATGTYDLNTSESSYQCVNELGTEGIVTPQGTFTALPSHTGIIPADITKNLWRLGEVAPQLIARLGSLKNSGSVSDKGGDTYNDTTNIGAVNVYPTKDYDMDRLLTEAKAKARITRHNN